MPRTWWSRTLAGLALAGALFATASAARAEDYVLGPEDVIQVSVWLHPELERTLTIATGGEVVMPPLGEIKAAGLTPKQLADRLADKLSGYLRQTTTVTVAVTKYLSRSVWVSGSVANPGRLGFEKIPGVLDVLSQAGGAMAGSDLSQVQLVRKVGERRVTTILDVAGAMRDGDTSRLPALQPGDQLVVPAPPAAGGASAAGAGTGIGVLGEVAKPGIVAASETQDLWTVLALSGGTTGTANLADVRVLTRGEAGVTVNRVNLRDVLDRGSRTNVPVRPGDVVVVMRKGSSWNAFLGLLGVTRDAINLAILVDYFQNKGGNN